jgi:hypothetical protein
MTKKWEWKPVIYTVLLTLKDKQKKCIFEDSTPVQLFVNGEIIYLKTLKSITGQILTLFSGEISQFAQDKKSLKPGHSCHTPADDIFCDLCDYSAYSLLVLECKTRTKVGTF